MDVFQAPMTFGYPFERIGHHDRLDFLGRGITPEADVMKAFDLDLAGARLRQDVARGDRRASGRQQVDEPIRIRRTAGRTARKICALEARPRPPIADLLFRMIDRTGPASTAPQSFGDIAATVASKRARTSAIS